MKRVSDSISDIKYLLSLLQNTKVSDSKRKELDSLRQLSKFTNRIVSKNK